MLCVFALAPASPLIAAAALVYFLFCTPLLRWTMIFLYKPKFDIGGQRFPFIFDICVSGMVVGQILLIAMMSLKRAIGPAFGAFFPLIPTIWFRYFVRKRYLRAFNDAALLQTSLLVRISQMRLSVRASMSSLLAWLTLALLNAIGRMGHKRRDL
jgi:hypothetical protein